MNITRVLQDPTIGSYDVRMIVNASASDIQMGIFHFIDKLTPMMLYYFIFQGMG
jgi:hypothetical protein